MDDHAEIIARIDGSIRTIDALRDQTPQIHALTRVLGERLRSGGTLYTAGNGGSAAQAMHLAEELIGRYRSTREPLSAMCLNADATALTCIANDFGYDEVFARPCSTLLTDRDALLVLSTSGNSRNIIRALEVAKQRGAVRLGLLGHGGGPCAALCDHAVTLAETDSAWVQEAHQVVVHLICEGFE